MSSLNLWDVQTKLLLNLTKLIAIMDIYIYDKIPCDCGQGFMVPVRIYEEQKSRPKEKTTDLVWQCIACRKKISLLPGITF